MARRERFPCPCCGYLTMEEEERGSYDICPVCFWEDDGLQFDEPDDEDGANHVSLNQARENFRRFGACDPESVDAVRPPKKHEIPST